jgi:hypothetical protein
MPIAIVFQTLTTTKVAQTDPHPLTFAPGELRVVPDENPRVVIPLGLRVGDQTGFEGQDNWQVPFNDRVELTLMQEDNYSSSYWTELGSATVTSAELNHSGRSHTFTTRGAHVVLTYSVRELPN